MAPSPSVRELLGMLSLVSQKGPLPASGSGSKAVGITLLDQLGVSHSSSGKARIGGVVINARRGTRASDLNRVNLFAKVPDWHLSTCKSSQEILENYGYADGGDLKLFCSVSSRQPNSQGLMLHVDRPGGRLNEIYVRKGITTGVATWRMQVLRERLAESHPETLWVTALAQDRDGIEHFHYRFATHTGAPNVAMLEPLLQAGTVTMDHLISNKRGRLTEKGPLFKIKPSNIHALFGDFGKYDLMEL